MASLVPEFEYDIFISYRQKDNKGDRWVSEFVEALKVELESTFKEEISVYFDVNPHDGLLETNDVDASLKEKLRCLIFIPIISRTYCDPKSFAWKHEFLSFIEAAQKDQFGLKVTLINGNVSSRILPVRIHDLDPVDTKLCESVLGGVIRGVDFVYKSAGVNRPLTSAEVHPQDNIYKIYYRDQVNKVANAIKDLITVLTKGNQVEAVSSPKPPKEIPGETKIRKSKIIIPAVVFLILITVVYVTINKLPGSSEPVQKTIAVLPFEKWFSDKDYYYLGDAVASQISSQIRAVKELYVISFNSTRRYTVPDMPSTRQIGKECGANFLVQGSVELFNNNKEVAISVQLINTKNSNPILDEKFKAALDSLQVIRSRIIIRIAQKLQVVLSPEEIRQIETGLTKSSDAYKNFLSANYEDEAASLALMGKQYHDSTSYEFAIKMYDKAILDDSLFALAYARRAISRSWAYATGSISDKDNMEKCKSDIGKALRIDPKLAEAYNAYGFYYCYFTREYHKAIDCFKRASDLDPGNWQSDYYLAIVYRRIGEWNKSQWLLTSVLKYNPQDALVLTNIGTSFYYLRDYDSALYFQDLAIKIMPNWSAPYSNKIAALLSSGGTPAQARIVIDTASKRTGNRFLRERISLDIYESKFREALIKTELSGSTDFFNQGDKLLQYAMIHKYLNNPDLAKIYYDSALVFSTKNLEQDPESITNYIQSAYAYAGLENAPKAIEAAKKAVKFSSDVLSRDDLLIELAEIYIMCGDYKNGLKQIEYLLKNPSSLSVRMLMLDPVWKPALNRPEFNRLISEITSN
jgi:TolB-like protein/Tfp pilus assembly protein PilF